MAVHGYITHAAHNRRYTTWLVLAYILAFELIGAFALIMPLLIWDHEHTILSNPLGYALRYALPIAALAGLMFWVMFRGHAKAVTHALGVRIVSREDEPRLVHVAEEQCTALGVRLPRFGIIEASEPNAVTVGEGPIKGLIAVTRGLLDKLDDDELAAVLAHEASHIRNGDTRLLAANHALMRTAVMFQIHNPLRMEDWRQIILSLLLPPMLLVLLAGSAATMMSVQLSRAARRGLKLGRDYTADGEAIRVTHFPEALISAIEKVGGQGAFRGSARVAGMLFDEPLDHDGGRRATVTQRIDAIRTLGRDLMNPLRQTRDSRVPTQPIFGRRPRGVMARYPRDATGRPLEKPRTPARNILLLYFTDRAGFQEWQDACSAWEEWRLNDRRNIIGLAPKIVLPVAAACIAMMVIYWPKDGSLSRLLATFNPVGMVDIARETNSGPFCTGPSYPDGKCPGAKKRAGETGGRKRSGPRRWRSQNRISEVVSDRPQLSDYQTLPPILMPIMLFAFVIVAIVKPSLLRKLFGAAERETNPPASWHPIDDDAPPRPEPPSQPEPIHPRPAFVAQPTARSFGRRRA